MRILLLPLLSLFSAGSAQAAPRELGDIEWLRDFDAAVAAAKKQQKPILILFDEVPGCPTCIRYGEVVLSHPLIVEAVETEFVPLAIYNNLGGPDRKVLKAFREPSWNNPVVRFIDAGGTALAPRLAGDYSRRGLVDRIAQALHKSGRPLPGYLSVLQEELKPAARQTAHFSMGCFWSGEVCLGAIEGVLSSRTGFGGGRERVEVTYDPARIDRSTLLRRAKGCGMPEATLRLQHSRRMTNTNSATPPGVLSR